MKTLVLAWGINLGTFFGVSDPKFYTAPPTPTWGVVGEIRPAIWVKVSW